MSSDPDDRHWAKRCEAAGLPSISHQPGRPVITPRARRSCAIPSTTIEAAEAAVKRNLSDQVNANRIGSLMLYHYPQRGAILIDHAVTFRVLPLRPEETILTLSWCTRMRSKRRRLRPA